MRQEVGVSTAARSGMIVRPYRSEDEQEVLRLLLTSLGPGPAGERSPAFFRWKHLANPFGPSFMLVAEAGGRIVGLRAFLRWRFELDGRKVRAVRAVDTATHPDHQGRGIFRRLTLEALDVLRGEADLVFNTPNGRSLPGYLKMGWREVGRLPVAVRPRSASAVVTMLRARTPAEKWSLPSSAGEPAGDVVADRSAITRLLARAAAAGLRTRRTPEFLAWRYGFGPLCYRAVLAGRDAADGLALFRLRRRGSATEAAITDVLVPDGDPATARRLCRRAVRESGADYAIVAGRTRTVPGFVSVPRQGPTLVWRQVHPAATMPALPRWSLTLGDVELF